MPLHCQYPKAGTTHKRASLIAEGQCVDSSKVKGVLTNKTTGATVSGKKLASNATSWGYQYKGLTKGPYNFTINPNSALATAAPALSIDFNVDPTPPPPNPTPPTVSTPANGDQVATMFYPCGNSNQGQQITQCTFADGAGNSYDALAAGNVTQPDANGDWSATIDASGFPAGDTGCTLTVANASGPTAVNNLSLP
jgi:hypothetical protein